MVEINRYEKHKGVVVDQEIYPQIFPPVTTAFVR